MGGMGEELWERIRGRDKEFREIVGESFCGVGWHTQLLSQRSSGNEPIQTNNKSFLWKRERDRIPLHGGLNLFVTNVV